MIIADTNVISEIMRQHCDRAVINWFDGKNYGSIWVAAPSLAEIRYGIENLPATHQRELLETNLDVALRRFLAPEIISFNEAAANIYGKIVARRQRAGHAISTVDAMIAAICIANGAELATRNTKDFQGLDLKLVNPFEHA